VRGPAPDFSTRPGKVGLRPIETALLVVALIALVASGRAVWRARADLARGRAAVARLSSEAETASRRAQELRASTRRSGASLVSALLLSQESPPPSVISDLATLLPDDVRLDALVLEYGDELEMRLRVVARDSAAYDRFFESMLQSPRFVGLTPGSERREGEIRCALGATYRSVPQ
jgi:hypothetical protein